MMRAASTIISLVSLMLCVMVCAFWVRSAKVHDELHFTRGKGTYYISTRIGGATFAYMRDEFRFWKQSGAVNDFEWSIDSTLTNSPVATNGWMTVYDLLQRTEWLHFSFRLQNVPSLFTAWRVIELPDWFAAAAFAAMPLIQVRRVLRRSRRIDTQLCVACGYDLRATPDRCPECGRAVTTNGTMPAT
jgi:hypothetical protein